MAGFWNAHSDRDWEDRGFDEPEPDDSEEDTLIGTLYEEVKSLKATVARMQADLDAATKWASDYEREHGTFKVLPPDFMISF